MTPWRRHSACRVMNGRTICGLERYPSPFSSPGRHSPRYRGVPCARVLWSKVLTCLFCSTSPDNAWLTSEYGIAVPAAQPLTPGHIVSV